MIGMQDLFTTGSVEKGTNCVYGGESVCSGMQCDVMCMARCSSDSRTERNTTDTSVLRWTMPQPHVLMGKNGVCCEAGWTVVWYDEVGGVAGRRELQQHELLCPQNLPRTVYQHDSVDRSV